jgi:hypothetical protein
MRRSGACATNPGCAAMGTLRQRSALITSTARRAVSCAHPGSKAAAAAAGPRPDPLVSRTGVFSVMLGDLQQNAVGNSAPSLFRAPRGHPPFPLLLGMKRPFSSCSGRGRRFSAEDNVVTSVEKFRLLMPTMDSPFSYAKPSSHRTEAQHLATASNRRVLGRAESRQARASSDNRAE